MNEIEARILNMIDRKDRFESEIRHALRHDPPDEVDAAIARFRSFLNDRRVIEAYLNGRSGRRTIGRERIRSELAERHAPPELIEEALAELPDESDRAIELLRAESKGRSLAQAGRFLVSRGFNEEAVESALDRFFGEG